MTQAQSYAGSKISLISKADVRYVGILCEVNLNEQTVALNNVRCFGTEGRKQNPAEELPPTSMVYDYIVFRASDVKDIVVDEPPPIPQHSIPNDPAIVNVRYWLVAGRS